MDKFIFNKNNKVIADNTIVKYPKEHAKSAVMPLLTLAQKQNGGNLSAEIITYIANYINISEMDVYEVANFYSMYTFNKVGKFHFQFCKSVVCMIVDKENLFSYCKKLMGIKNNENISEDALFSIAKVECLGACVNAPVIKVNDIYVEDISTEKLTSLINEIKKSNAIPIDINVKTPKQKEGLI